MLAAALAVGAGCSSPRRLPPPVPEMTVVMGDYRFDHPGRADPGRTVIRVRNAGSVEHAVTVLRLPDDLPPIEKQLASPSRLALPTVMRLFPRAPGGTGVFALDLLPGRYALVCFVTDPDGRRHALEGMSSELLVR